MTKKKKQIIFNFIVLSGKKLSFIIALIAISFTSCAGGKTAANFQENKLRNFEVGVTGTPYEIQETKTVGFSQNEKQDPSEIYEKISPDNFEDIKEIGQISPFTIPHFQISSDGKIIAVGTDQLIFILDADSGEIISEIPAKPADCKYGMGRYFRLNENGTFIGIVGENLIEVWQVGGGKIHESEFNWKRNEDNTSCGGFIPEISISPDGDMLAVSGKEYSADSPKQRFRVIDIPLNDVIYEWDGTEESLHGNLYTYSGLGFSADGKYLQTFDPKRFTRVQADTHWAFRFWEIDNWRESTKVDQFIQESFSPGNLYYSMSTEKGLEVRSRLDGRLISRFDTENCSFAYPCESKFSQDGNQMAVLSQIENQILYRNHAFFKGIEIWDISQEKQINEITGLFRNLDGILPSYPGKYSIIEEWLQNTEDKSLWWISEMYFDGLKKTTDRKIYFVPQSSDLAEEHTSKYSTNCQLVSSNLKFVCVNGSLGFGGERVRIDTVEEVTVLMIEEEKLRIVGELPLISLGNLIDENFRLLGFSGKYQIGFFCLDDNFRQEQCLIYDFINREPVYETENLSFLRSSPDGKTAAFFNTKAGRLFIFDLENKKIEEKTAYQSRAASVNPVFNNTSTLLIYMVQNIENKSNHSFDVIDLLTGKVLRRVNFEDFRSGQPAAFAVNHDDTVWAIGSDSGEVQLVDPSDGFVINQWFAHEDAIAGIEFIHETQQLITMGQNGVIKFWRIEK